MRPLIANSDQSFKRIIYVYPIDKNDQIIGRAKANAPLSRRRVGQNKITGRRQAGFRVGTGRAVTDLIFSIANREVTFFSATALMSFL
ncbi:hypothetical protein BN961_04091 [Afipia felis]|uniref:Uncharacterized protein n=1 Tax=Afipia felis TaxID=1035 RepID=A0A090MTK1_AFIFE|nr:hypothetical protein BN961_04091 [Afipia felis]